MEYEIELLGKQDTFISQCRETILEAAIRSGVSLEYGCSIGTCGLCKAKLVSGEVEEIRTHEYVIPEAEKLQNYILTCVCAAKQNLVIDAPVASSVADIPKQSVGVKVRKIDALSSTVVRLLVQTPRTNRLRFLAGQYMQLEIAGIGSGYFSIASCPCEDRRIEFHVRISENDPVSFHIANVMRPGDPLELHGPFGNFVFDESADRSILLFAFDAGFAAIKSLLEHITAQEQDYSIDLIWLSCGSDGLYMNNLCRSWGDALDQFSYQGIALHQAFDQLKEQSQMGSIIVEKALERVMRNFQDLSCHDVYVCAPLPAIVLFERICTARKLPASRFFIEPVRGNEDIACMTVPAETNRE